MSNAKIILFGEHSVVYGKKAISLKFSKLNIFTKISIKYVKEDKQVLFIKNLLLKESNIKKNIFFNIFSNIPISSGLGSSAALAIAMTKSFNKYFKTNVNIRKIVSLSEKEVHGNPSGIDENTLLAKKPIIYSKNNLKYININLNCYLLVIFTRQSSSTIDAVNLVKNNKNKEDIINNLGNITEIAIKAIKNKDIYKIANLMNEAQKQLKLLNLSTKKIDYIINICNEVALGSKITGAGLGGSIIALVKNTKDLKLIYEKLKNEEIDIWNMPI